MTAVKPLGLGWHQVGLECPDCGDTVVANVELLTVRQVATDEAVTLRVKVRAKKLTHTCGQGSLFEHDEDER
jgi:hypothetical protein